MSIINELKTFITKGNVIDLAVAVVIGQAFNTVITAFVSDIITPLIGVLGHVNFSSISFTINNSVFNIGLFLNALISFLTIAVTIFFFVIKPITKINEHHNKKTTISPQTKICPECLSTIPLKAKKCAFCTSVLDV